MLNVDVGMVSVDVHFVPVGVLDSVPMMYDDLVACERDSAPSVALYIVVTL